MNGSMPAAPKGDNKTSHPATNATTNTSSKPRESKRNSHKPAEPAKKGPLAQQTDAKSKRQLEAMKHRDVGSKKADEGNRKPDASPKKENLKSTTQPVTRECPLLLSPGDGGHVPMTKTGKEGHTAFPQLANIGHGAEMQRLSLLDLICLGISTILPLASRPFFKDMIFVLPYASLLLWCLYSGWCLLRKDKSPKRGRRSTKRAR